MTDQGKNDGQFYRTLPVEARKTLHDQTKSLTSASKTNQKEGNEFVLDFVQKRTVGDMEDISANFKKNFPLRNAKTLHTNRRTRHKKKHLTSIEKRKMGLHKLPKTGLEYSSFEPLHKLWLEYMEHFLDLDVSTAGTNQDQLHQRIAKADFNGCLLMVTRSKCPSYIGAKGIVVMETKNTFQIICQDNQLRILPKRDSVFTFTIRRWTFTLFGNHLNIRPSERASRKFKSRPTIDL